MKTATPEIPTHSSSSTLFASNANLSPSGYPESPNYLDLSAGGSSFSPSPPFKAFLPHPISVPSHQRYHYPNSNNNNNTNNTKNNTPVPHIPRQSTSSLRENPQDTSPMTPRSPEMVNNENDDLYCSSGQGTTKHGFRSSTYHGRDRSVQPPPPLGPRSSSAVQKRGRSDRRSTSLASVADLVPYHQYRARQRRDASMGESVWDDELEAAFMEADRIIPNLGRTKMNVDGKLSGRNELIADYIFKLTGKKRSRKQVSSHIQVLKNLLKSNPEAMKSKTPEEGRMSWSSQAASPSAYSEPTPSLRSQAIPPGRSHSSMGYFNNSGNISAFASPPPSVSGSHFGFSPRKFGLSTFLIMVGTKSNPNGAIDGTFHTYTSLSPENSSPASSISLSSLPDWQARFPLVASITDDRASERGSACTILHIKAGILPLTTKAPTNGLLCTHVEVSLPDGDFEGHQWDCVTRIYAPGKLEPVWVLSHSCLAMTENPMEGGRKLKVPFAPDFWSAFYNGLSRSETNEGKDEGRHRDREFRSAIKGITVVQELFSYPVQGLGVGGKERSAVLMWEFTKADTRTPASAVWREIIRQAGDSSGGAMGVPAGSSSAGGVPREVYDDGHLRIDTTGANDGWASQQQNHSLYQISPYEELSPSQAELMPYCSFEDPRAYTTRGGRPPAGLVMHPGAPTMSGQLAMNYLASHTDSPYSPYAVDLPVSRGGPIEHYLHGNGVDGGRSRSRNGGGSGGGSGVGGFSAGGGGGAAGGGGIWSHHLSPTSDGRGGQDLVENGGGVLTPY